MHALRTTGDNGVLNKAHFKLPTCALTAMSDQTPQQPATASPRPRDGDKKRRSPDAAAAQSARKKARTPDTVPRRGRIVRLLVGGREHATTRDTLSMVPDSFLDR